MNYTDEQIYNAYINHKIINEFSQKFYNDIKNLKHKHIYILYDTNSDTLYELYITIHDNGRNSQRGITNEILLQYMDHCLECVPLEFLDFTNTNERHVVFDIFDDATSNIHDGNMIACHLSYSKQSAQFGSLFQDKKNVTVCDITVKTFMNTDKSGYMDFCKQDYINKAIHIPVSSTGKNIDLSKVMICCDVNQVNNAISKITQPINIGARCKYYYSDFFNALQQIHLLNYPVKISTSHTMPLIHNVKRIDSPQYMFNMKPTPNTPANRTFMNEWDVRNSPVKYNPNKRRFDKN